MEDTRITNIKEMRDDVAQITLKLNEIIENLNNLAQEI